MKSSLGIFLKRSLVFPILLFSTISLHWSLRKAFFSLLAVLWNSAFKWVYLPFSPLPIFLGFSCGSAGKESTCNVRNLGSIRGLGRAPGEGNSYPLQYFGLENSMDCLVHGVTESQTRLNNFHFHSLWQSGSVPWRLWGQGVVQMEYDMAAWYTMTGNWVWCSSKLNLPKYNSSLKYLFSSPKWELGN